MGYTLQPIGVYSQKNASPVHSMYFSEKMWVMGRPGLVLAHPIQSPEEN